MLGDKPAHEWVAQYAESHQHPVNRFCHTVGIPMIVCALVLFVVSLFVRGLWPVALALFLLGWVFQFVGHYYEGRKPAFVDDLVGLLVGPMFVVAEGLFSLGWGKSLLAEIERRVGPTHLRDLAAARG